MSLDQRFADAMGQLLGPDFPSDIALAVSGGGDSMAMLTLAHNWTRAWGVRLWVVTIDHGLRPESAEEATLVAEEVRALGHPHATLRWHWDGAGNKMDAARRARLDLIDRWRGGIRHVLMAHTQDDVAETFLMRLERGSGVDGLAGMAPRRRVRAMGDPLPATDIAGDRPGGARSEWFEVLRPCLDMTRTELRHYLTVLKGRWVEDPSNEDSAYGRVRMRRLLALLQDEGIGAATLAATAERLREDRFVLAIRAEQIWRDSGAAAHGILMLDPDWHGPVEATTQRRLLNAALRYVSGADYGPRAEALEALRQRMTGGGGGTLHGCELQFLRGRWTIFREYAAVAGLTGVVGDTALWDGRWRISAPDFKGLTVRALGEDGWAQAGDKPEDAPPFRAALSLPSIWDGDRLVACDALGIGPGGTAALAGQGNETVRFSRFLLSH
ncbi:tRNA lysidine(34) synthetase TilS [Aestuariicoccus sp. MJ-SS9]|uniref:tRNA lysidine(34) synthetase TilS n=1 Tax=Aestuariicoccus sp. MJ-SS9 TaxID=3079855 RepID=UPI00290B012E|nr:tRNA lysidine(34) synthetase TilS [Aestuariicoccus sp. MJ-SS9]MDU8910417.1 tRNA lysidine(34) synthetase TilS [Aestuariicoccus sp. MJ-SS9]